MVRSGNRAIKCWLSITDQDPQMRFLVRIHDPFKQGQLSPLAPQSRLRWELSTTAKANMFARTTIAAAPWDIVDGDDKKRARLTCTDHLLTRFACQDVPPANIHLPERVFNPDCERATLPPDLYVPQKP